MKEGLIKLSPMESKVIKVAFVLCHLPNEGHKYAEDSSREGEGEREPKGCICLRLSYGRT